MNLKKMFLIFNVLVWFILPSMVSAAGYIIDDFTDELIGASNVLVNDIYYDVTFQDGTALEIFGENEQDRIDAMAFSSDPLGNLAIQASYALMQQVFNSGDRYDTEPWMTRGIEGRNGYIMTAFKNDVEDSEVIAQSFQNSPDEWRDEVNGGQGWAIPIDNDLNDIEYGGGYTWAVWTAAEKPPPVPEPATILLLGLGIVGFTAVNRKKVKTA